MTLRLALALSLGALSSPALSDDQASPVGVYDGGQIEIGAQLELKDDGRFDYILVYGALDEFASGTWSLDGDALVLTSDPVNPPAFDLEASEPGTGRKLLVEIAAPESIPPQFFASLVTLADGSEALIDFDGPRATVPVDKGNPPAKIEMAFPMYEVVSPPFDIAPGARRLRFRFEPNDLGRVAFNRQVLPREAEGYILERHGRRLVFRRMSDEMEGEWAEEMPLDE